MKDQTFLELVRKFLWSNLLWRARNRYEISHENSRKTIKDYIHYALRGEYYDKLGASHKERRRKAEDDINMITARAILEPLLDEAGMKYYIK